VPEIDGTPVLTGTPGSEGGETGSDGRLVAGRLGSEPP
jgi:hypothetical protein